MLKVLYWLLLDVVFINILFMLLPNWNEAVWYIIFVLAAVAFFTWELICAIKNWLGK